MIICTVSKEIRSSFLPSGSPVKHWVSGGLRSCAAEPGRSEASFLECILVSFTKTAL